MIRMKISINSKTFIYYLRISFVFAVSLAILLFLDGCASHRNYESQPNSLGYTESGKASYYSKKLQFRKTASGERLDNYSMTAAHRTLPFGTKVMVTNVNNGKTVLVIINDRGPHVKGRIIDLTRAAFSKIENIDKGIAEVEIRVVN
jgi:rare lipoprotein A